jgi:hypothetical protein
MILGSRHPRSLGESSAIFSLHHSNTIPPAEMKTGLDRDNMSGLEYRTKSWGMYLSCHGKLSSH